MKVILIITFTCLSFSLLGQTKEDSIRWQKLAEQRIAAGKDSVYQQLLRAKQPENYINPPSLSYSSVPYYTKASKQLLLEVLEDEWITEAQKRKEAEKKVWQEVDRQISTYEDVTNDTIKYSGLKRKRKHFQILLDSLQRLKQLNVDTVAIFQAAVNRWVQEMDQRRMPDLYIYTAGMLDSAFYVPFLQEALKDTVKYNPYVVKMALARFRLNPYYSTSLETNQIDIDQISNMELVDALLTNNRDIFPKLVYLCSQESIKEYSKLLALKYFECIDMDDYSVCSIPSQVLLAITNVLLNESFKNYIASIDKFNITKEDITWVQNWLEENYGNYELDRDFYPGLR